MQDSKILDLLWNREESALDALETKYGKLLYRIAYNILGRNEDAQECVNDTILALWNAIPPQRPEPLCPYVCRTGRYITLNRLRSDRAQKRGEGYDLSVEELSGCIPGPSLESALSARALAQAIDDFLDTQRRENRVLFVRRYWFGDSVQEAAKVVGLSPKTAAVRLYRLREKLKEYLIKEALYEE